MKMQRMMFEGAAMMLVLALLTVVLTVPACKEQLGVNSVPQARNLSGNVQIAPFGIALNGATVNLRLCSGQDIQTTVTDNAGRFEFKDVPIVPEGNCYRVLVQAPGYNPKDTTVACNCTQLLVGIVYLTVSTCDLDVTPAVKDFGTRKTGETDSLLVTVQNPGTMPVNIQSFSLARKDQGFTLDSLTMATGASIGANRTDTRTFRVRFTAPRIGDFRDTVLIYKHCSSDPERVILHANVATCALTVVPPAVNFGTMEAVYADSTINVTITNTATVPATIDSFWIEPAGVFTITPASTRRTLAAGVSMTVAVRARALAAGTPAGKLVVRTDCSSATEVPIAAVSEAPSCNISQPNVVWTNIAVGRAESTDVYVKNTSQVARLRVDAISVTTTSPAGSPNVYSVRVDASGLPYWIKPKDSLKVVLYFNPAAVTNYQGALGITSNSTNSCGAGTFSLIAAGVKAPESAPGVLLRWSPFTSTGQTYFGWRFTARAAQPDSFNHCDKLYGSNNAALPQNQFGTSTADFNFGGYSESSPTTTIELAAIRGAYLIPRPTPSDPTYKLSNPAYELFPESTFSTSTKGCGIPFKVGDIVAIKQIESGRYALILIKYVGYNSEGIQELGFDAKFDIPIRTLQRH
jgi:hypothetical protein